MTQKLSILLINYNQAKYLPDSLESILRQTRRPYEIIVTDDASTDASVEILNRYQAKYPQLKLLINEKNLGMHANANRAASLAKGDFITILAADDLLFPSCLDKHSSMIQNNPDIGLSCSDLTIFEDRKPYQFEFYQYLPGLQSHFLSSDALIETLRHTRFWIASCGCFYHRKRFLQHGGFDADLKSLGDYYINYQLGFRYGIGYFPGPLSAVRIVANSYGNQIGKNFKQRYHVLGQLMTKISQESIKKNFFESRILSYNGLFMMLYLSLHPIYWNYFPGFLIKSWKSLAKKILYKILQKKISPFSFPRTTIFSSMEEAERFLSF